MSRTRTALLFALALPLAATGSWAGAPGDYADGPRLDDAPPALKALLEEARPTAFSEANAADAARIISSIGPIIISPKCGIVSSYV